MEAIFSRFGTVKSALFNRTGNKMGSCFFFFVLSERTHLTCRQSRPSREKTKSEYNQCQHHTAFLSFVNNVAVNNGTESPFCTFWDHYKPLPYYDAATGCMQFVNEEFSLPVSRHFLLP